MEASKCVSGEDWRRGKGKAISRKSSKMEEEVVVRFTGAGCTDGLFLMDDAINVLLGTTHY